VFEPYFIEFVLSVYFNRAYGPPRNDMMKILITGMFLAVLSMFLTTPAAAQSSNVQLADGSYTITGGSNNGTAAVAESGKEVHYIDRHGQGTIWTWDESKRGYKRPGSSEVLTFQDGEEEGSYKWSLDDPSGKVDSGTATS
jgi:hypothetical protein